MSARWAVLVLAVAAAAALVGTAWVSYAGVRDARRELERGQGQAMLEEVRRAIRPGRERRGPPDAAELEEVREKLGIPYLAFEEAYAGTPGQGVRFVGEMPPPPGMPPPGPTLVVEIRPVAGQVVARAARTLVAACVAAGLMLIAGGAVFRWLPRRERERQLAALGEMSAVLAHELKNPLASLKGNAQLVAEAAEGTAEEARAQRVVSEAVRLEELTRDLLAFVRTGEIRRREVAPAELLRTAAEEVDAARIDVDAAAAPARWSLDEARLRQALVNLLRNAVDAAPDQRVAARVWSEAGALRVEVRDRGAGVEAGREEAIFEPFHTTKTHGTGLGLAVARRVVELHGGRIAARNHPSGGAVFELSIPGGGG